MRKKMPLICLVGFFTTLAVVYLIFFHNRITSDFALRLTATLSYGLMILIGTFAFRKNNGKGWMKY